MSFTAKFRALTYSLTSRQNVKKTRLAGDIVDRGSTSGDLKSIVNRSKETEELMTPNLKLGFKLVSDLCFELNTPTQWKLLYQAIASRAISSFHVLALLTVQIIPKRREQPEAYRLYLELLRRYLFADFALEDDAPHSHREKITKYVDDALQLSTVYGIQPMDFWHIPVFFLLRVMTILIDGILEDLDVHFESLDFKMNFHARKHLNREKIKRDNLFMTLEVLEEITMHGKTKVLFRLIHLNIPGKFDNLVSRLRLIEAHESKVFDSFPARHVSTRLLANIRKIRIEPFMSSKHQLPGILIDHNSCYSDTSASWVSLDVYMENAMDRENLQTVSAVKVLAELVKTLRVINHASWQEAFLALWVSALRLVQRDRVPWEEPMPRYEPRLCMLLSIVPLAIVSLVNEEGGMTDAQDLDVDQNEGSSIRGEVILSLQLLGQFSGLLVPPPLVVNAANDAASKVATSISNLKTVRTAGNLLHLIVEACITRNLINTSVYRWLDALSSYSSNNSIVLQESPWSRFMQEAQLTDSVLNSLIETPASSILELKKVYQIALNGCDEEKSAAAKILCGASLTCGWNIQEKTAHMVLKLISPPNTTGTDMSFLSALLFDNHSVDKLHILSLYGLVPELTEALLPLCESFGSIPFVTNNKLPTPNNEKSLYGVFSCAFLILLRLWEFCKPPKVNYIAGNSYPLRLPLHLDYIIKMRNNRYSASYASSNKKIYEESIESFPKLRAWYYQMQACKASAMSDGSKVHQVAHKILNMICSKTKKPGHNCGSPVNDEEIPQERLMLSAWEVLEVIPDVLEAILSACAHGIISSIDLTKALKNLVDFLPASFATMDIYFSKEITRGMWPAVPMNGIDWPSPAANLVMVESEVKEVLESIGICVPNCYASGIAPVLPLPMAALVSLSITFNCEKNFRYLSAAVNRALTNCASRCPSSSTMSIIGALWIQKVCSFRDHIIFNCSRFPITSDKNTIPELIRSCFSSFLGTKNCSINRLLGDATRSCLPVAPGYLYLRTCHSFQDTHFLSRVILNLVVEWSTNIPNENINIKNSSSSGIARVRNTASLGATLLCITGGQRLVHVLYKEVLPDVLISKAEVEVCPTLMLIGYSMAYFLILCGAFVWGLEIPSGSEHAFVKHMDFIASVIEGKLMAGCDDTVWKAYVLCFIGLLVRLVPMWVKTVSNKTLYRLANGLKGMDESELAIQLIERGGLEVVAIATEFVFRL